MFTGVVEEPGYSAPCIDDLKVIQVSDYLCQCRHLLTPQYFRINPVLFVSA